MTFIRIDPKSSSSLTTQLIDQLRSAVKRGILSGGEKLPGTRSLSADVGISRGVIQIAYEQLIAEGYLEGNTGSGTYVRIGINEFPQVNTQEDSSTVTDMGSTSPESPSPMRTNFLAGQTLPGSFPEKAWKKIINSIWAEDGLGQYMERYQDVAGNPGYRKAISEYSLRRNGQRIQPDRIFSTKGTLDGILSCILLLKDEYHPVIEDPGYHLNMIRSICGENFSTLEMNRHGPVNGNLENRKSLLILTPAHQFPLGSVLSIQKRQELLSWARSTDSYIIEDDYDGETRHNGYPIPSLHSLDSQRVLYLSSFSKCLAPSLRLGYLALPEQLCNRWREFRRTTGAYPSSLHEAIMTEMLLSHRFSRHLNRITREYQRRRKAIIQLANEVFQGSAEIFGAETGAHIVVRFPGLSFAGDILPKIRARGVAVKPVLQYSRRRNRFYDCLIIGYSGGQPSQWEAGFKIIAEECGLGHK